MGRARAEVVIERPADGVWRTIGDFGDLDWFPGLESWTVDGDVRRTKIAGRDLVHVEREVHRDDHRRTFSYETLGYEGQTVVSLPDGSTIDLDDQAGRHRATIAVGDESDTTSRVTYEVELDDAEAGEVQQMGQRYQQVLAALKDQLES